uniref:Electron transport protein n=1 Tax=Pyrococcus abyssi (strain GE5 / Orsay) TaxID=272844 RepID=G8ZG96_PYRAB|nr:TPA: electron transport protein [Pyrococcus abyssi GE5]
MRIEVNVSRCAGCRYCELWCSYSHEGVFSLSLSRITIVKDDLLGMDVPVVCRQCDPAPCMEACPTGAIKRENGVLVVSAEECTGCGECVRACPFGAVKLHVRTKVALICDLCGGDPVCIAKCPTNALSLSNLSDIEPNGSGSREYEYALRLHKNLAREWGINVR